MSEMVAVECDERRCYFNHNGFCEAEVITIARRKCKSFCRTVEESDEPP